jgi:transposase-like protein
MSGNRGRPLSAALKAEIVKLACERGIKAAARILGVSKNTVRKALAAGAAR